MFQPLYYNLRKNKWLCNNGAAFLFFSLSCLVFLWLPPQTHPLCSLSLHYHPSFTLGLCPPCFLPLLSSLLRSFVCHTSTTHPPTHPFLTVAFKKSSHLRILTVFSRQQPATQRDLNCGELWDGCLPIKIKKKHVTPFEFSMGNLWWAWHLHVFHVGACVSLCCIR